MKRESLEKLMNFLGLLNEYQWPQWLQGSHSEETEVAPKVEHSLESPHKCHSHSNKTF